jgi:alpha-L-arabinofuranosidase
LRSLRSQSGSGIKPWTSEESLQVSGWKFFYSRDLIVNIRRMPSCKRLRLATLVLALAFNARAATIEVQVDKPGAKINPAMWGIFFEDINLGADGGLYAEMVKNRGFEFPDPSVGWTKLSPAKARGSLAIRTESPFNPENPHYLHIETQGQDVFGVANEGFRGMGVREGEAYDFSAQIRIPGGNPKLRVELYSSEGARLDSVRVEGFTNVWKKFSAVLRSRATDAKAKLYLLVEGGAAIDIDMVSLFPQRTWKNRPGGLRADMVQLLADLKPGFLRFPGGCIVEGSELDRRYQWKKTIGPVEARKLLINRWNYEFLHRPAPDYYQSFGLGFFEFFQLCDDIGAEPLPILNCGMACQFNSGELCPMNQLEPYVQDALDLIEFANGPVTSEWGAKRAALGHAEPFRMKMLGIGNEQWDQQYMDRYARFHKTLKEKHPEIQLVSSAGPSPDDAHFKFAWPKLRELKADIVDEHCYARPDWFFNNTHRFDNYDRNGPKVFFGEYAAQSDRTVSVNNRNNLECAIAEAAYMTGLERNADVVRMASYAPLFAHQDGWQWRPNLIWVDNLRSYATPNYYVQQLFSRNAGDVVLPTKLDLGATNSDNPRLFASATWDQTASAIILKLVNGAGEPTPIVVSLSGVKSVVPGARAIVLTGGLQDENSFEDSRKVAPYETQVAVALPKFNHVLPPRSLNVLRIKANR